MQNSQNKLIIIIGTLLIVSGMMILTSNYFNEKVDNAYTYMNNLLLENTETEVLELRKLTTLIGILMIRIIKVFDYKMIMLN